MRAWTANEEAPTINDEGIMPRPLELSVAELARVSNGGVSSRSGERSPW